MCIRDSDFPALRLAYEVGRASGFKPAVFNAANEKAVSLFLNRKIRFLEIPELIEMCMDAHKVVENPSVDEILAAEAESYDRIASRYA